MNEKKRIYVIFDHSADMLTFSEIKSSCNAEDCGNYFYTIDYSDDYNNEIKANSAIKTAFAVLVMVDSNSKYLGGMYDYEIESALHQEKPIIVVNKNGNRSIDLDNCPICLRNKFALHISNSPDIINAAILVWPLYYDMHKDEEKHSMYLEYSIYKHYKL